MKPLRPSLALTLAAALIASAAAAQTPSAAAPAAAAAPGVPADAVAGDMSLGDPKARVHVVEYASASCPHCAHFNEETFPALKAKYIDTGRVYYTLKEFLTPPPNVAIAGFLLARCGGKAKYFTILDQVFRSQPQWSTVPIGEVFTKIGADNGLSKARIEQCLADPKALDEMKTRVTTALNVDKVDSTPTLVVNGKRLTGDTDIAALDAAIAEAEKASPAGARKAPPKRKARR